MAFAKTSISISKPHTIKNSDQLVLPGDVRGGKVWDGKQWVTEEAWAASQQKKSV